MRDHELVVLAGVLPSRRDRLMIAEIRLASEHFVNEVYRNLFQLIERYHHQTNGVLPKHTLSDMLIKTGVQPTKALLYEETYSLCETTEVQDHEWRYSLEALRDNRAERLTGEAITLAFEVLERGIDIDGEHLRGHADARSVLLREMGRIDRLGAADSAPEGELRGSGAEALTLYNEAKSGKQSSGILTGIPAVDDVTAGLSNGELVMVAGFTGEGKSQWATQTAWRAAVMQGKNVFFATSETVRSTVRRRIEARHSKQPQFQCPGGGLNSKDIKLGRLSPSQEDVYRAVVDDIDKNPAYGKMYIAQIPRGGTLATVEGRLRRAQAAWNVDLLVVDYLALLKAEGRRQTQREEYNDIIKDAKLLATSHDDGRGVPLVSPWQMSQTAWREAKLRGSYELANLAETSEAERSADLILTVLSLPNEPNILRGQFLKNRDGEIPPPFEMVKDFRSTYLEQKHTISLTEAYGV